jgi:penicillin-binding protein 2
MKHLEKRRFVFYYIIGFIALVMILRAAQLQLFSTKYRDQARKTTLEKNFVYPSRGIVFDRHGATMVYNKPIYVIYASYKKIDPKMDTLLFCSLLNIDKETFVKNLEKDWKNIQYSKSVPFVFLNKVSAEQYAIFQEHSYKFPGFEAEERSVRGYPHNTASHVLGYLGEVDDRIIKNSGGKYRLGDYIGKTGIEYAYEKELAGEKGVKYILKDKFGRHVESYNKGSLDSMSVPGDDIHISIDLELQKYADSLMMNKRGGLIAIEPSTGEILAMVSAPFYDPNLLTLDENRSYGMRQLLRDSLNRPLNNRAVTNKYPPGSIFKPVQSLIALQMGIVKPERRISCFGGYRLSASKIMKCHSHAPLRGVGDAIKYSCNTYYLQTTKEILDLYGYKNPGVGLDTLVSYLKDFGLGQKLGSDVGYEGKGFLPDSRYYGHRFRKETGGWRSQWVLSIGIGQGEIELTTLQMANLAAIIANRGTYITPHLIKSFKSGRPVPAEYRTVKKVRIDKKHFVPVIDGMEDVVLGGTARAAYVAGLDICGKTGTSQNPHGKDHSVFFGFAPKNNPKIAIAVFVENAGWGGDWAAPISSLLIEKYLNKSISPSRKYLESKMFKGLMDTSP